MKQLQLILLSSYLNLLSVALTGVLFEEGLTTLLSLKMENNYCKVVRIDGRLFYFICPILNPICKCIYARVFIKNKWREYSD